MLCTCGYFAGARTAAQAPSAAYAAQIRDIDTVYHEYDAGKTPYP